VIACIFNLANFTAFRTHLFHLFHLWIEERIDA